MRNRTTNYIMLERRKRWYRLCRALALIIFLGSAVSIGFVAGLFAAVAEVLPRGNALADIRPPTPTRVLASDGSLLAKVSLPDQNRELLHLNQMGKYVVNATLAIEDVRFHKHPGIDIYGILRAMKNNLVAGDTKEGASTITQQLARNLYLSREKKVTRKLQEIILALELERRYSKDEILETYLNQVYYGSNQYGLQSWGVQVAAQNYFEKDARELTLAQAALLAGLPKNPRDYNPYKRPDAARQRRNTVLATMLKNDYINRQDYEQAINEPIKLASEKKPSEMADYHAPYFVRYILVNEMKKILGEDAEEMIYHYGIDIYTSLDPRMQKVAEEAVIQGVEKNKFRKIDEGALISIDPKTGLIKAMVGGMDFRRDQYNVVTQGHRQPGSSFKPFVYTTAIIHGYTPDTIVFDRPHRFPSGMGSVWSPKNSDGRYLGAIPLKKALWLSRNCAAAATAYDVGINNIISTAHAMGIKYRLDPNLSTSLGASVVVPMEICSGYGTLANGGVHHPPTGVLRVTTPGGDDVLYEYRARPERAIPTEVADTMQDVMRGVIERGTARAARCPFPASGKTGTTNSYKDAWFIGYTDDLVTAVWVGNRNNQPMNRTFGGTVPAPIWKQFMLVAQPIMAAEHKETQAELARVNSLPELAHLDTTPTTYILKVRGKEFARQQAEEEKKAAQAQQEPSGPEETYTVTICQDSGDRATPYCPNTILMTFTKGQQAGPPTRTCTQHTGPEAVPIIEGQESEARGRNSRRVSQQGVVIAVCAETNKIATDKCPIVHLRRFLHDAPSETCPLHGGD